MRVINLTKSLGSVKPLIYLRAKMSLYSHQNGSISEKHSALRTKSPVCYMPHNESIFESSLSS